MTSHTEWPLVSLQDLLGAPLLNGSHQKGMRYGSGTRIVRMVDIYRGDVIDIESLDRVEYPKPVSDNYLLIEGDLLINRTSVKREGVGKASLVTSLPEPCYFDCSIIRVRPDKTKADPRYLLYVLNSPPIRIEMIRASKTATITTIAHPELKRLEVPLPPLSEQQRIAAILTKADHLRRLRRTARDLSDTYLQSVFLEMFGDGSTLKTRKLGELLLDNPKNGLYLPAEKYGSGTPIIRINNFYGGVLGNAEQFKRVQATPQETEEFAVVNGEILINRVNSLEYLGKCALVQGLTETTLFESNMMRLRVDEDIVLPIYLVRFLTTQQAYSQIVQRARKAVNQASINQQDVKSLLVPVPPLSLQQEFAHIVHKFERLRAQQREAQRQAEHLFQTLLHRAFRGELGDPKGFGNP